MGKIYFYISFVLLCFSSYLILNTEKNEKIQGYLENKTKRFEQSYNVLYGQYKKLSSLIYHTRINTKEVLSIFKDAYKSDENQKARIRKELFEKLNSTYSLLKDHNLKQLHFHLPDNESFLRFHRPSKFGDNLTNIRDTIKYVNRYKKPVDGFEEGRIYNGYRFVYPLFYEGEHIGSVEASFSTLVLSSEFMKNFNVIAKFLISKDVVNEKVFETEKSNYIKSKFDNFYLEKKIIEKLNYPDTKISDKTRKIIENEDLNDKNFSLYDSANKSVLTFIKIKNPISDKTVGIMVIKSDAKYIHNKTTNFYMAFGGAVIFIILALMFLYKNKNQTKILNQTVREKTKKLTKLNKELENNEHKLQRLNENLEIKIKDEVSKNREKDRVLFEQSKMAALGEMIGNIAHQWRQPLSAISTGVSSMQLQKELNLLTDDDFHNNCNSIVRNVDYLSKTIDDFRNFIRGNSKKEKFNIKQSIQSFLSIVSSYVKKDNIDIRLDIEDIQITGLQNELNQCLINLFNNARDALSDKREDKYIFIKASKQKDQLKILFKDNAGGIKDTIIDKIFEPYFTTKHQSQGTGLGLHMTYKLIVDGMDGTINVHNETYIHEGKEYSGAVFEIIIPLYEEE